MASPDEEATADAPDEMTTRDLGTLHEDGPELTRLETPSARGMQESRPAFSPVAQPGMNEEIWYRTVESRRAARTQERRHTPGMIGRLNMRGRRRRGQ